MRSDGETEGAPRPQHETTGPPASAPGLRPSSDLPRPGLVDGRYPRDLTYAFSLIDGRTFAPHNAPRVEALRPALRDLVHAPGQVGGPPR